MSTYSSPKNLNTKLIELHIALLRYTMYYVYIGNCYYTLKRCKTIRSTVPVKETKVKKSTRSAGRLTHIRDTVAKG